MRPSAKEGFSPAGLWLQDTGRVIIKRTQLGNAALFAGTLLHEFAHARTGHADVSRDFEIALTDTIGRLASRLIPDQSISASVHGTAGNATPVLKEKPKLAKQMVIDVISSFTQKVRGLASLEEFESFLPTFEKTFADDFTISLRPEDIIALFRAVRELANAEIEAGARFTKGLSQTFSWPPIVANMIVVAFAKGLRQRASGLDQVWHIVLNRLADEIDLLAVAPERLADPDAFVSASRVVAEFYDVIQRDC